jgi:isopenicillin N synthase-like dioxygenase
MGPNVWPDTSLLAPADFREPVERYFAAVNGLALKLLALVARTLPYGPDVFARFTDGHVIAPLRLLHYPPANESTNGTRLGAGAHTDFGAITLLLQDENPGLEVLDLKRGTFVPIEPTPAAFVVNVGACTGSSTRSQTIGIRPLSSSTATWTVHWIRWMGASRRRRTGLWRST